MTGNTNKVRAVILAALMVFSVFAGTMAFSGSVAAQQAQEEFSGGAVHYENLTAADSDSDNSSVIEVPFDGPIENDSIDSDNFTVLDDGDDISDQIDYEDSADRHDGSGNVELIVDDGDLIVSRDLEVDLSSEITDDDGEKSVAFAAQTIDLGGDGDPSGNETVFKGTTVAFQDSSAVNDSDVSDFQIEDNEDSFDYFQSFSAGENSTVFFFNTADREIGEYEMNSSGNFLTLRELGLDLSVDDLNVTTDDDIEGTVETRSSSQRILVELLDDDGDEVATDPAETSGQGDYDFSFDTANRDEGDYTVKVTHNASGVEVESSQITLEEQDDDAQFTQSTVEADRGDIAEMTVEIEDSDFATITAGEVDGSEGFVANATVEDDDGDGQVTVYFNTYELVNPTSSAEPFALDDDSDDNLDSQDVSDNVTDLIDAGQYDLEVSAGETAPAETSDGADGVATLSLNQRTTDTVQMWTGSKSEIGSNPSDLEDINEALENDEITQSSEVAVGDWAVHQVVASGLEGALNARENEDVTDAFLTQAQGNITELTVEEADPGANQDEEALKLGTENTTVIADGPNDTYFVLLDTDAVKFQDTDSLPQQDDTALEANFSVLSDDTSSVGDFTPDDFDDDENEETIVDYDANEVEVNVDEPFNVSQAEGQTVSGDTNIAPGTELTLRVRSDDGVSPSFLKTANPIVQSDGTYSTTFDFSEQSVGDDYDIQVNAQVYDDGPTEEDGTVVEGVATAEPGTDTPEPDTDTPEPDTDTPEPDTDTPEPDTDTPEPDTDTPEPETEEPTSTPTSTPGFGVIVALTALLAAALLAVRRD